MRQLKSKPFESYVGVYSLEEMVTKDSRVCVINILGSESRKVTPVSHEYSKGNVVAGVQYGREGKLETKLGDIPVYPSVREVIKNKHHFDTGVIYLPPTAVSQAVSELLSYNHDLKRIIIVTEKVSTADSRNIRFLCQEAGVDVIGCNCLGIANAWDEVRIGGALGGDAPEETLHKGSIAIHSNSGNFTTTMAEYLRTEGFGISTAVSSGKDVYIHFALAEFLFAAQNDPRTRAVALYVEPGGYYEKVALEMIAERRIAFSKPIVVCVTGRWKKDITRSCGHAGALSGAGDDAISKENWFDEYFGVGCYDPDNPVVSKRGVRVDSIQTVPVAMKAVFDEIGETPDFASQGDLSLKLWLSDNVVQVPPKLDMPMIEPLEPYAEQLGVVNKQVGAQYLRQSMSDKSGASRIDPMSHVAQLHNRSILDLSTNTLEENIYFSLAKIMPEEEDLPTINTLLNLMMRLDSDEMVAVDRARANGATPNAYLASELASIGNRPVLAKASEHISRVISAIREYGIDDTTGKIPEEFDKQIIKEMLIKKAPAQDTETEFLLKMVKGSKKKCTSLKICKHILTLADKKKMYVRDMQAFLLGTMTLCIFWKPLLRKRVSRQLVEDIPHYLYTIARTFACSVIDRKNNKHWQKLTGGPLTGLKSSFTENAYQFLFNAKPGETELLEFKYLIGLTLTNGPGTISAKGAKESVSARNYISMAFVGFLANTGLAHGGNGFEAVEFLLKNFAESNLVDPGDAKHGIDLKALAAKAAKEYGEFKVREKALGALRVKPIPCINHPVFKGAAVNIDPREDFICKQFAEKGIYNVFVEFYHLLVQELFNQGITRNVFCVNIDAVLAVIALKLVWDNRNAGKLTDEMVQNLVFTLFLYGRTIGVAAEIVDHRDRGTDMDCRTPQSKLKYVL
ncbi:MAG: CoA-binding protein [bacterium]|nr:CoA-binding protein [bacterium]